ncbi:MAG: (2Fe-2S)-binding protein [Bdellovibrionales bacterium]|nr:(2Fe-2S)-binding protein [Bdellovibrionales bacterium]
MGNKKNPHYICLCNSISEKVIKSAIEKGIKDADELYDRTGAGVGPCGGSCRKTTTPWIEYYKKHKKFPSES